MSGFWDAEREMAVVSNVCVYDLEDSFRASKYPMAADLEALDAEITDTVGWLAKSSHGSGHDQFLTGIVVQFDLTFPIKAWREAEQYHFLDFMPSRSTMYRAMAFDIKEQVDEFVPPQAVALVKQHVEAYIGDPTQENWLAMLRQLPVEFRLTARMTTNYRQLKTIYAQRKAHTLPEWRELCAWMEMLPHSEWITGMEQDKTLTQEEEEKELEDVVYWLEVSI